jgi:hypothetical protein
MFCQEDIGRDLRARSWLAHHSRRLAPSLYPEVSLAAHRASRLPRTAPALAVVKRAVPSEIVTIEREDVTEIGPGGAIIRPVNEWPVSTAEQGVMKVGYVGECRHLRSLLTRQMLELPKTRRICCR